MRGANNGPCDDRGRDGADMKLGVPIRGSATGNLVIDHHQQGLGGYLVGNLLLRTTNLRHHDAHGPP
ncbi:hypothetical protein E4U46_008041, partial [Claviceps purpurea]